MCHRFSLWVWIERGPNRYWDVWAHGPKERLQNEIRKRNWSPDLTEILPAGERPARTPLLIETVHYFDGISATGPYPLPPISPNGAPAARPAAGE